MNHWYAYHSEKTMGHTYASVGASTMYMRREPSALEAGDLIWVIEGDLRSPTRFTLVDCFEFSDVEYPPFKQSYQKFAVRITGHRSLLMTPSPLNRADAWFADLHGRFITKQRFFNQLNSDPHIIEGLASIGGVML